MRAGFALDRMVAFDRNRDAVPRRSGLPGRFRALAGGGHSPLSEPGDAGPRWRRHVARLRQHRVRSPHL